MRYKELITESHDLEADVAFLHKDFKPQEGDDFLAIAELIAGRDPKYLDQLIDAYKAKYGDPHSPANRNQNR